MRAVLPQDLEACTLVLLACPPDRRAGRMVRILEAADAADRFRKRTGRRKADWGDGTLASAAGRHPAAPRPPRCDAAYCACLSEVLAALAAWRGAHRR